MLSLDQELPLVALKTGPQMTQTATPGGQLMRTTCVDWGVAFLVSSVLACLLACLRPGVVSMTSVLEASLDVDCVMVIGHELC